LRDLKIEEKINEEIGLNFGKIYETEIGNNL
jgi:hypothetical protein